MDDSMNAETKKQLNVRIPVELYEKITQANKPQVELVIEALELYFKNDSNNDSKAIINRNPADLSYEAGCKIGEQMNHIEALEQQISMLKDQVTDLRAGNGKLMALLNQEQALHLQTQKLLPAPEQKKWWRFWK